MDFCIRENIEHLHIRYFGTADPYFHPCDIPGFRLDIMGPEYNASPVSPQKFPVVPSR
jgi:hypothetical protein